jgi:transposase-like protein
VPVPRYCRNPKCSNHTSPDKNWRIRIGSYQTLAHGAVQRYRCRCCGKTTSDQSESIHYYAKRRLPVRAVIASLNSGSSMRDIGRRYGFSCAAIRNGVLRIGRQAMAAQILLLNQSNPRRQIVFDGLRSFVTAQDYPCDITTVVDRQSEVVLTMTHAVRRRAGVMKRPQQERAALKYEIWSPRPGTTRRAIYWTIRELWNYLRPCEKEGVLVDTDEDPLYRSALSRNVVWQHLRLRGLARHRRTSSKAPRTYLNPLFPVNYVDRLLRHRVKEHTRETIAFGRHATVQMHRAWIFAWDHNMCREYRVKRPELGLHGEQGVVSGRFLRGIRREFCERRLRIIGKVVPWSIVQVWRNKLQTPPVRWRAGQKGTMVKIPGFALRDLAAGLFLPAEGGVGSGGWTPSRPAISS